MIRNFGCYTGRSFSHHQASMANTGYKIIIMSVLLIPFGVKVMVEHNKDGSTTIRVPGVYPPDLPEWRPEGEEEEEREETCIELRADGKLYPFYDDREDDLFQYWLSRKVDGNVMFIRPGVYRISRNRRAIENRIVDLKYKKRTLWVIDC